MTESCVEDFASVTKGSTQKLYSGGIMAGSAELILGQSTAQVVTHSVFSAFCCCQMGFEVG